MVRLLFAVLLCGFAAGAEAAQPVPYEAFYDLSVKDWKQPGEVLHVTGSQIVRAERSCTDWTLVGAFRLDFIVPPRRTGRWWRNWLAQHRGRARAKQDTSH
jgi:hypothetical protein